jgi:hypothetical protein
MASPEYSQISDDDFNRSLMGSRTLQVAPEAAQVVQVEEPTQGAVKPPARPTNRSSVPNAAAPPSRASDIDLTGMVNQVTDATTQMQKDMPAPKPADSSQHIMDLVAKHWQIPAAVIGTLATGAILNKLMGGEKTSAPPLGRVDPLMDVSRQGPIEPSMEGEKPSIKSRSFAPSNSPEEQALIDRSEVNRIAKEQDAARRAKTAPPTPIPEPPAFIRNQPPVVEIPANPKIPALLQAPAGAVAPPVAAPVVAAPTPVAITPAPTTAPTPASATPSSEAPTEAPKEKPTKAAKPSKSSQPAGTGGADNWLHSAVGPDIYADVIKRKNEGKPYGPGEAQQTKAYKDWREYQNEVGRMRPYTKTPVLNLEALEAQKFKSANIPGKIPFSAVPPPMLRPTEMGQGGGSLLRSLTDQLQLKQ